MSRVPVTTVIVALVLLAGCGSTVAPAPDGTPTGTVTPAPVPRETPTPRGPPVLAPGLSEEGVFDPVRLADAHAATLSNTSFTAVREERRRYENGSFRSAYRSVVRVAARGDRFRYELNQTDVREGARHEQRLARYSDGSVVYVATTRGGRTTYSVVGGTDAPADPSTVLPGNATARFGVLRLFGSLRFDPVDRRTVDGRTVYRLTVENGSQTLGGLRDVTMNATVREDGIVTAYRLAYDVSDVRVTVDVEFRRIGDTRVTSPAWLPAARDATGTDTARESA
ncbi:MAG: hypothetical protein V5A62_14160 [Haloarculaceae archaeon]